MPYKHIAAYLKKTELACRLHYHQLSHGSNRRKRTTSMSSGSSNSHSPVLHTSMPSPIHEHGGAPSRSVSPPDSAYSAISPGGIQLPSIMSATASTSTSPRLPTILPKPASMSLAMASMNNSGPAGTSSPTASRGYPTPLHDTHPPNMAPMTSTSYRGGAPNPPTRGSTNTNSGPHHHGPGPVPLRLDCSALPPPPSSTNGLPAPPGFAPSHPVDMARLNAVYNAHRASFWAAVAADYGPGANPMVLEQAWRGTSSSVPPVGGAGGAANMGMGMAMGIAAQTPITPVGSPDDQVYSAHHHQQQQQHGQHGHQGPHGQQGQHSMGGLGGKPDKTRISAILGIDANPRSPSEREMVRRIEEERGAVRVGMA